jgi:hypothetical protein
MDNLPRKVSANHPAAVFQLYPAKCRDGSIMFADHNDGEGIWLTKWDSEAPLPTDSEVAAVIAEVEAALPGKRRQASYVRESDALVIRAMRLQMAGDPGADAAKDEALAKVAEIKARHPDLEAK